MTEFRGAPFSAVPEVSASRSPGPADMSRPRSSLAESECEPRAPGCQSFAIKPLAQNCDCQQDL